MTSESNLNRQESSRAREGRLGAGPAVWISTGTGLGVALGLMLDNLALGIAIGAAVGLAVGAALDQRRKGAAARDAEPSARRLTVLIAIAVLLLAGAAVVFVMLPR
jgi:hypothetical protein